MRAFESPQGYHCHNWRGCFLSKKRSKKTPPGSGISRRGRRRRGRALLSPQLFYVVFGVVLLLGLVVPMFGVSRGPTPTPTQIVLETPQSSIGGLPQLITPTVTVTPTP